MTQTTPRPQGRTRVVIAGGGVAGLETALALRELAASLVDVEILAPEHHFWYRPLAVAEPFDAGRVLRFELADLAHDAGAVFTPGTVVGVDAIAREVETAEGPRVEYDVLVLALGATPRVAVPGAFTFRGPADAEAFRRLLDEAAAAGGERILFVVPPGTVWPLPLYELALMTAAEASERGLDVEIAVATSESAPLEVFGEAASDAVAERLAARDVALHTGCHALAADGGALRTRLGDDIRADRAVALPRLEGPGLRGVPQTRERFVRTDAHGRVLGVDDVYAAGDLTAFPVKQGGVAAQQADAVAEAIAARVGADVRPTPFAPVLRGLLLTRDAPQYLRSDLVGGRGATSVAATEALWWPPGKIVGRHLSPFLAARAEVETFMPETPPTALPVEVELELPV